MVFKHDHLRRERTGLPEAILCEGKHPHSLSEIMQELTQKPDTPFLFTRMSDDAYEALNEGHKELLDYHPLSATAILHGCLPERQGRVAVITAGTSDLPVAHEAARTLQYMGVNARLMADVGVAGIWRLMERLDELRDAEVIIAVAGMDAALPTVAAGLLPQPIIGVPTSVGYGVANRGDTALNAMLSSCAQGIVVTNIDNGFGAACAALRILRRQESTHA
jgi:NCAIR mutase (PurE)-related protein